MYSVVWPRGKKTNKNTRLAKRINTLASKTICELWNYNFQGNKILTAIETKLSNLYPGIKFVNYEIFGNIHGPKEREIIASLSDKFIKYNCDGVISCMGC